MKSISTMLLAVLLFTGCGGNKEQPQVSDDPANQKTEATPDRDISTPALVKLDSDIQRYDDAVQAAKKQFEATPTGDTRSALVNAHVAFGDYMTYESPVSPRQGKYHRALVEYYAALKLDPGNTKVKTEIAQIEDIYRGMGREIPVVE